MRAQLASALPGLGRGGTVGQCPQRAEKMLVASIAAASGLTSTPLHGYDIRVTLMNWG